MPTFGKRYSIRKLVCIACGGLQLRGGGAVVLRRMQVDMTVEVWNQA